MSDIAGLLKDNQGSSAAANTSNYMNAASEARGLLNAPDNFNRGMSYGDEAMSKAIRNKGSQKYSMGERRLANEMRKGGQDDYVKKLQITSQLANEEHQINVQKEIMRQKQEQARKAARGQVIGTVLGITGAVAGGMMTGGAGAGAGAMAGYQIGSGVGNMAGGM